MAGMCKNEKRGASLAPRFMCPENCVRKSASCYARAFRFCRCTSMITAVTMIMPLTIS
jgi:hypothetical protein